jgi:hypothetical protein
LLEDNVDGLKLISRAATAEIIGEIIFSEDEKALLPLVQMEMAKRRKNEKEAEEELKKALAKSKKSVENSMMPTIGNGVENKDQRGVIKITGVPPEQAYQNLVNSDPENLIK